MSKEKIAALQKALAQGEKSFDFGAQADMAAKRLNNASVAPSQAK